MRMLTTPLRLLVATLTLLLALPAIATAQPNQYAEFQRSISDARSNAAYIEAIESSARTPNAKYSPLVLDKVAVEEMVTTWKRNLNQGVPMAPRSAKELEIIAKQQRLNEIADNARQQTFLKRIDTEMPFYNHFQKLGFGGSDAERFADLIVSRDSVISPNATNVLTMAGFYKTFTENAATAPFPELLSTLLQYEIAPYAAIESLKVLEKRFPSQQYVIDMTYLKVIPYFYRSVTVDGNTSFVMATSTPSSANAQMSALFLGLARKYPQAGMDSLRVIKKEADILNRDPVQLEYLRLYAVKKGKDAEKLSKEMNALEQQYPAKPPAL